MEGRSKSKLCKLVCGGIRRWDTHVSIVTPELLISYDRKWRTTRFRRPVGIGLPW